MILVTQSCQLISWNEVGRFNDLNLKVSLQNGTGAPTELKILKLELFIWLCNAHNVNIFQKIKS